MVDCDDMVNNWGVIILDEQVTFSRTKKSFVDFDTIVKAAIPDYQLRTLTPNGTTANAKAIEDLCFDKTSCLIAMGCYVGGDGSRLQELSSSSFDKNHYINKVNHPSETEHRACRNQTVPFPYYVNYPGLSQNSLKQLEDECLEAIEVKVLVAILNSHPYRGLLLEPMLSGNGGELTDRFLQCLAVLLGKYQVKVVLDEVMTGGRVGPKAMLMESELPESFRNVVEYVTMGKILNCGLVLEKKPRRPTDHTAKRGESTLIEPGEAFMKFRTIQDRIVSGIIPERRMEVLKLFGLSDEKENVNSNHWGRGCFIFTTKARPGVNQNLKCRLTPKLERTKLSKLSTKESNITTKTVCTMLHEAARSWYHHVMDSESENETRNPFVIYLAKYLIQKKPSIIFPNALLEFVGKEQADTLATEIWAIKRAKKVCAGAASGYKKKAITYLHEMLADVAYQNPGLMNITRKGKNRQQGYVFHYEKLPRTELREVL